MPTLIPASVAEAKFSDLLQRVASGESFSITVHGQEIAQLVPSRPLNLTHIQHAIAEIKATRRVLNPPGQVTLNVKDLQSAGRP